MSGPEQQPDGPRPSPWLRGAVIIGCVGALVVLAVLALRGDVLAIDDAWLRRTAIDLGPLGPLALIAAMVVAVVVSPVPSGPIAMAAGALYGTTIGAVVSIVGAALGALIAFGAARYLGFDAVRRSQSRILKFIAVPRSQGALMAIVFGSRLIPFLSFDAISYAAGLTNLTFFRFAVATVLGVVPVGWMLAAMGSGMANSDTSWALLVLVGGGLTLVPALLGLVRLWARR